MTKAQDKLLQRIAELKEQCTLEQAAKAHMEDALRNDIEERDHIISTLNTKVKTVYFINVIKLYYLIIYNKNKSKYSIIYLNYYNYNFI